MADLATWQVALIGILGFAVIFIILTFCGFWRWCFNLLKKQYKKSSEEPAGTLTIVSQQSPVNQFATVPVQDQLAQRQTSILSRVSLFPTSERSSVSSTSTTNLTKDVYNVGENYNLGKLHFILDYNYQLKHLSIKIVEAIDLAAMDLNGKSDPYVKAWIVPDKHNKVSTKIKERTLNPKWNESFVFEAFPANYLHNRVLYMQVIDYDRFSKDEPIGEVYFPLENLYEEKVSETYLDMWKYLKPCKDTRGPAGEILISLCYTPQAGRLTVTALEAKDLKKSETRPEVNPFCKIKLRDSNNTTVDKNQTSHVDKSPNPSWNEGFVYSVPVANIRNVSVDIIVISKEFLKNEEIGRVRLGAKVNPEQAQHWSDMLSERKQSVVHWHKLKYN